MNPEVIDLSKSQSSRQSELIIEKVSPDSAVKLLEIFGYGFDSNWISELFSRLSELRRNGPNNAHTIGSWLRNTVRDHSELILKIGFSYEPFEKDRNPSPTISLEFSGVNEGEPSFTFLTRNPTNDLEVIINLEELNERDFLVAMKSVNKCLKITDSDSDAWSLPSIAKERTEDLPPNTLFTINSSHTELIRAFGENNIINSSHNIWNALFDLFSVCNDEDSSPKEATVNELQKAFPQISVELILNLTLGSASGAHWPVDGDGWEVRFGSLPSSAGPGWCEFFCEIPADLKEENAKLARFKAARFVLT